MRPAIFVPDSKPVDALLSEMQAMRQHIAVVVDEYGGTAGPDHDRGPAGGDRRRDHRRVRRGGDRGRAARGRRDPGLLALPDRRPRRALRLRRRGGGRRQRGRPDGQAPRPGPDPGLLGGGPRPALRGGGDRRPAQQDRYGADQRSVADEPEEGPPMSDLSPEDAKLVTLARATRARTGAAEGAAVRDENGRTYAAATVELPSLRLTALEVCVAMAIASGSRGLEAAVVLTERRGRRRGAGRGPRLRRERRGHPRRGPPGRDRRQHDVLRLARPRCGTRVTSWPSACLRRPARGLLEGYRGASRSEIRAAT